MPYSGVAPDDGRSDSCSSTDQVRRRVARRVRNTDEDRGRVRTDLHAANAQSAGAKSVSLPARTPCPGGAAGRKSGSSDSTNSRGTSMTTLSTLQDVIIAGHELTREQLGPEAELTALGIDSLDFVELLFQVEDRFDIEIPGDTPADLHRVGDLVGYIDGLVASQSRVVTVELVASIGS